MFFLISFGYYACMHAGSFPPTWRHMLPSNPYASAEFHSLSSAFFSSSVLSLNVNFAQQQAPQQQQPPFFRNQQILLCSFYAFAPACISAWKDSHASKLCCESHSVLTFLSLFQTTPSRRRDGDSEPRPALTAT